MPRPIVSLLALTVLAGLAACSSPVHRQERFIADSPYEARFGVHAEATCEAARRTLLSQGYAVTVVDPLTVSGTKDFQPDEDEHVVLDLTVVCATNTGGSVAYASAVETMYALKEKSDSAGLSLSRLGSISLPWGSSKESLVKVGAETVKDADFYARFFTLMGQHAPRIKPARKR